MAAKHNGFSKEVYDTVRSGVAEVHVDALVRDKMQKDSLSTSEAKREVAKTLDAPSVNELIDRKTDDFLKQLLESRPVKTKISRALKSKGPSLKRDLLVGLLVASVAALLSPFGTFFVGVMFKDLNHDKSAATVVANHYSDIVTGNAVPVVDPTGGPQGVSSLPSSTIVDRSSKTP